MAVSPEIQDLIDNPIETLHVELKGWLDLTDQAVRAKAARHLAALANHGGRPCVVVRVPSHGSVPICARANGP